MDAMICMMKQFHDDTNDAMATGVHWSHEAQTTFKEETCCVKNWKSDAVEERRCFIGDEELSQ